MKKLITLVLLPLLFTFALANIEEGENWQGNGVKIESMIINSNIILKATSTREGFNTLISPLVPMNTTLKYSFLIKAENTNGVLAEIAYFNENKTFIFAKNVTFIGKGSFKWKNIEITATPFKEAKFSSLVIIINGTGTIYLDNLTISEVKAIEKPKTETTTTEVPPTTTPSQTETSKEIEATTTTQEMEKEALTNETETLQRLLIDDEDIKIEIFLNKTYHPGDTIRADFYITNKKGVINEIDIKLEVYYFGIKVFSYEHPSWREYSKGKTIHIFQESKLPIITPPGKYILKFYITPVGRETKEISTSITVKPNAKWFLFVITVIALFSGIVLLVKKYWKLIAKTYKEFSIGQKFVFFAIIGLITAAVILALGAENYANDVAIAVYYLLVIGVLNEWIEYLEPKWDRKDVRGVVSVYVLAFLLYLSKDNLTAYPAILVVIIGAILSLLTLKHEKRTKIEHQKRRELEEIEIVEETENGFIIYEIKGEKDEREE
ncbi:hypothetical protein ADU37_CDS21720 [Thermococcus sp. 2319x1]|uniref:hypothetical protein n=1 Tax=Thermococcus sp. 2319x1 TaxID=1674923 RepID=UPI00073A74B6|nr:hypothetical protein [Thermococcus sp. 2319x1]ALV63869.1 hypothetical protein ADU37_CDS21720 [Thermococcus sp. 2319x1]